jgi:Zn-dependent protease with chaperone function
MSFAVMLCLVLVATFGLTSLLLSIIVAVAWHGGLARSHSTSGELLALRLLPAGGAILLALTVVLPAFLIYEPTHQREAGGPLLIALTMFALLTVGVGIWRAWCACMATGAFFRDYGPADDRFVIAGQHVDIVDVPKPIVAVVGGWRPRIVMSKRVVAACSNEELRQVIAHEAAHVSGRDNLKLLLLVLGPDALGWLPAGVALAARWRAAAERDADERATGSDRHKRLALASALIKVARLSSATQRPLAGLSMQIAVDDVEGRVRGLLAPARTASRTRRLWGLAVCVLVVPVICAPLHEVVHQFIEALVAFGC